jgi:hypothetical protein
MNTKDATICSARELLISRRAILRMGVVFPSALAAGMAQAAFGDPRPYSARIIQSGHSLTDPIVPVLKSIVEAVGGAEARRGSVDRSTVPGSLMEARWEIRLKYPPDARIEIDKYDVLVITERAPLSGTVEWHDSNLAALVWFEHAWNTGSAGQGAETILYATWVNVTSGPGFDNKWKDPEGHMTFRDRMAPEMLRWQTIADFVNANRSDGSPPMTVIPGPLIFAEVYDAIEAGKAPGLSELSDLFSDDIHLNDKGAYLIALAHFAVIYRRDPRIVPDRTGLPFGVHQDTAIWMKEVVANVLQSYPGAGLKDIL